MLGAVLAALGMALHLPAMPEDVGISIAIAEAPSRWLASHVLMGFGLVLVAVAAVSALPIVRGRGARLTTVGVILTAVGAAVLSLSDMAHGAVGFALVEPVDAATSFAVQTAYFESPAILWLNTGPLFLTLGLVVLGAGLLRSRIARRWEGIVVMLTPIAVHASFNFELPTYLHGVPLVVGFSVLARVIARR
ncbi:MAG TPA: hypothetical protein VM324_00290 [Egibacteraceae bacterium]|nr:hypothetical protein [Egibacteraceae bacterium]